MTGMEGDGWDGGMRSRLSERVLKEVTYRVKVDIRTRTMN